MDSIYKQDELDLQLNSYDYKLDPSLIANKPKRIRHESRMMVVRQVGYDISSYEDKLTKNIIDELNNGDLIIVNDTKVMKARLNVQLSNGSLVELLILELVNDTVWLCLGKPAKKLKLNDCVKIFSKRINKNIELKIVGIDKETGGRLIQFPEIINNLITMDALLNDVGDIPLPPYIKHIDEKLAHENSYQTEYAKNPGAIAAPTAGLHLSNSLLLKLKKKGIKIMPITLHVGYGTFKPIDQNNLIDLKLHKEFVNIGKNVIDEIKSTKQQGKKIIAIGTTSVRALESCYVESKKDIFPIHKNVDLVIKPGFKFKVVDGLLTNFHLPKSSLLLLVSAMIGRKRLLSLYEEAIKEKYRFFSYGDAMYISPEAFLEGSKIKH